MNTPSSFSNLPLHIFAPPNKSTADTLLNFMGIPLFQHITSSGHRADFTELFPLLSLFLLSTRVSKVEVCNEYQKPDLDCGNLQWLTTCCTQMKKFCSYQYSSFQNPANINFLFQNPFLSLLLVCISQVFCILVLYNLI